MKNLVVCAFTLFFLVPVASFANSEVSTRDAEEVKLQLLQSNSQVSSDITPNVAVVCANSSINQGEQRSGCCSWHGGVSHCGASGYWICNDGTRSPSCRCD